ncbi:MAG: hypothetical protein ACTSQZ_01540 [Candidatus Thorarchaeota archaeon]
MSFWLGVALVCTVIAIVGVSVSWFSSKKYKTELENEGHAVSTVGSIGSRYLEGNPFWLIFFTASLPGALLGTSLSYEISQFIGWQMAVATVPFVLFLGIVLLVFIIGFFAFTTSGCSRRKATKILREYWRNPLAKNNFRSRLTELAAGDKIDRAAVLFISRRGCTASLIAREVLGV